MCTRFHFQALEHCLSAGEPINPEVMSKWRELTGLDIYEGYGQTETVSKEGMLFTFAAQKFQLHSALEIYGYYCF